jgi:hypothetical protein
MENETPRRVMPTMSAMTNLPPWFPFYVIAAIALMFFIQRRWPHRFWWAAGALLVVTFVLSAAWTFFQ